MEQVTPLKKARKDKGYSQAGLAEVVGVSQTTISDLERMREKTSPDVAEKIATVLGISEMEILYPERYQLQA